MYLVSRVEERVSSLLRAARWRSDLRFTLFKGKHQVQQDSFSTKVFNLDE